VPFSLDGLIDSTDTGSSSNMERGTGEDIENLGLHDEEYLMVLR
jgi:hypothetical protein